MGQRANQGAGEGQKVDLRGNAVVGQESRKASGSAGRFGAAGHVGGYLVQVRVLTADDAADQHGQAGEVACLCFGERGWIPLPNFLMYGTIAAEVVAHDLLLSA